MTLFRPIAALSLECVNVTWIAELDGTSIDPTGATTGQPQLPVQMAFPQSSGDPAAPAEPSAWFTASWLTGGTGRGFVAQLDPTPGKQAAQRLELGLPLVYLQVRCHASSVLPARRGLNTPEPPPPGPTLGAPAR